jgi:hypothetical protein
MDEWNHRNRCFALFVTSNHSSSSSKLVHARLQCLSACPMPFIQDVRLMASSYSTSPTILAASRYVLSNFSHFSLSFLMPSSSYKRSPNRSSLYNSLTRRFCTSSLEWLTSRCMIAFGTWSAIVSRTMLKYEEMRRRMSSVSSASRSVSWGSAFCSG